MKLKTYLMTALMLTMGLILHSIIPGIFGMKFDLLLAFMIVSIFLFADFKNALMAGIVGGILTAQTTTFPGGQIPNVIDKIATSVVIFMLIRFLMTLSFDEKIKVGIAGFLGTLVSGSIFLYSALLIVGLPAPFMVLFTGVVLPTCIGNTIIILVIYKAARIAMKEFSQ